MYQLIREQFKHTLSHRGIISVHNTYYITIHVIKQLDEVTFSFFCELYLLGLRLERAPI